MRFQIVTAVKIGIVVFWVMARSSHVVTQLPDYPASLHRTSHYENIPKLAALQCQSCSCPCICLSFLIVKCKMKRQLPFACFT
jgi:hypothetical protein